MKNIIYISLLFIWSNSFSQYTSEVKFKIDISFNEHLSEPDFYFLSAPGQTFRYCTYQLFDIVDTRKQYLIIEGEYEYVGGIGHDIRLMISDLENNQVTGQMTKYNYFVLLKDCEPNLENSNEIFQVNIKIKFDRGKPFMVFKFENEMITQKYFESYLFADNPDWAKDLTYNLNYMTPIEKKK